ncbi:MAG: OmpA family protein, partial [Halocynthiibacter sp.]
MSQLKIAVRAARLVAAALLGLAVSTNASLAAGNTGDAPGTRVIKGESYVPTIWVDPDGCEHWVMDDGAEGYMTPNVTR